MKSSIANQRGMTIIGVLASMTIMIIVGFLILQRTGVVGGPGRAAAAKQKAMGAECNAVIASLGASAKIRQAMNQPLNSLDDIIQEQASLQNTVTNENLWDKDGFPYLEYVNDTEFVISGYCVDGLIYEYDSSTASVSTEKWK